MGCDNLNIKKMWNSLFLLQNLVPLYRNELGVCPAVGSLKHYVWGFTVMGSTSVRNPPYFHRIGNISFLQKGRMLAAAFLGTGVFLQ